MCTKVSPVMVSPSVPAAASVFTSWFCLLRGSSEPPVSHPRADTRTDVFAAFSAWYAFLLFFCVFKLRPGPEPKRFLALNIPKWHFSLHFLHIQSCSLQYKRLLARLDMWETPLIKEMDPFLLFKYFALLRWLCARCIWQRVKNAFRRAKCERGGSNVAAFSNKPTHGATWFPGHDPAAVRWDNFTLKWKGEITWGLKNSQFDTILTAYLGVPVLALVSQSDHLLRHRTKVWLHTSLTLMKKDFINRSDPTVNRSVAERW